MTKYAVISALSYRAPQPISTSREQRLDLSVPQAFMRNSARGYVPPEQWDQGVNGGFLSYNANTYRHRGTGSTRHKAISD